MKSTWLCLCALLVVLLAGCKPLPKVEASSSIEITDDILGELEAYIVDTMERYDITGLEVAVVQGGEIIYSQGFGVREKAGSEPVTEETLMMIGSATKSFTTLMMGTLVDEGIMTWSTPVTDILPQFSLSDPEVNSQVTFEHLVCNCSGVPMRNAELIFNYHDMTAEEMIEWLAEVPLQGKFGKVFNYSNQMVAAGGYIAALAAGGSYGNLYQDYERIMQERVLDPIGMQSTTFSFEKVQASGNYAMPHIPTLDYEYISVPLSVEGWVTPIAPAGALWSNAQDMAKYLITQLNEGVAPDGTRVVSAENLNITHEPQIRVSNDMQYGLGWSIEEYEGLQIINHPGGTAGFTTDMTLIPELDAGIIVLSNQIFMPLHTVLFPAIRMHLLELLLDQETAFDRLVEGAIQNSQQRWTNLQKQVSDHMDRDIVLPYVGTYVNDRLGEVTITMGEENNLVFDSGEFFVPLRPVVDQERSFLFAWGSYMGQMLKFSTDDEGVSMFVLPDPVTGAEDRYAFTKVE